MRWRGVGTICIATSIVAMAVSLGLPGIGWLIAALSLVVSGLLGLAGSIRYPVMVLFLSTIHLFMLGPLSAVGPGSVPVFPWSFFIASVFVPFLAGAMPLVVALIRAGKDHKRRKN